MVPFAPDTAILSSSSEPFMYSIGPLTGGGASGERVGLGDEAGGVGSSEPDFLEHARKSRGSSKNDALDEQGRALTSAD